MWPNGKVVTTHELPTTIQEAKALITAYFRSIAATGVMTAKLQEQLMPVVYRATVRQNI